MVDRDKLGFPLLLLFLLYLCCFLMLHIVKVGSVCFDFSFFSFGLFQNSRCIKMAIVHDIAEGKAFHLMFYWLDIVIV